VTATWDDIVSQSQPAFYDDGAALSGTAGSTWRFVLESPAGADGDWSDVDFVCEILSQTDHDLVLLELTMTADEFNRITIEADAAATAILDRPTIQNYPWRATATKGTDVVTMWTAAPSAFTVFPSTATEGS